ncbi:hypothetical protein PM082_012854 [Marasmius tenuissimus]|nr:hypothetical protein PM082_012854 [Marasmius tenuissimus]
MAHVGGDDLDDFVLDDYANSSAEEELEEIDDLPADTQFDDDGGAADHDNSAGSTEKKRREKRKIRNGKLSVGSLSKNERLTNRNRWLQDPLVNWLIIC